MTISHQNELNGAIELHKAGRLLQAEAIYRKVLDKDPQNAEAIHLLGLAAHHSGRQGLAVECATKAVRIDPSNTKL